MKTTIEITDDLFRAAKDLAARHGTTLRALIEEGLRTVLQNERRREKFVLRDSSVDGRGTREGVEEGDWDTLKETIYKGRGS